MSDGERLRTTARRIIAAALAAADPRAAVRRSLSARGGRLVVAGGEREVRGRLLLAAVGKASAAMAGGALEALGPLADRIDEAIVVLPHGYPREVAVPAGRRAVLEVLASGHPVPDGAGLAAARRLMGMVEGMRAEDLLLVLLSGGGSSLVPLPAPGITLADKTAATELLLASGAEITEINTVRKHLSAIKGGQLAARCPGAIEALAISDVVGDHLEVIASGPTVADPTTFADALAVLRRHALERRLPASVLRRLEEGAAGRVGETPKGLPLRHRTSVVAGNRMAVDAAAAAAKAAGYEPLVLTTSLAGEAREVGRLLASIAREALEAGRPAAPPCCLIAGGETTVSVRGPGRGGRNQEIALAAAIELAGTSGILLASFATDGREGTTEAAGAFASGATVAAAGAAGLDPRSCLAANDSHAFLAAAGELIVTGPTGTNVNDLSVVLVDRGGRGG